MSGSYASVLSGQPRLPRQPESRLSATPPIYVPNPTLTGHTQRTHNPEPTPTAPAVVPTYLAESAYAERLARHSSVEQAHVSLPTPPPSFNAGKAQTSYRGTAFEIIEQNYGDRDEQPIVPLPSRWVENDKSAGIELHDNGLEARFNASKATDSSEASGAVRSDYCMPAQCGLFYFEVTILSKGKDGRIVAVGFCTEKATLNKLPGWAGDSWGYHGDDGTSFCSGGNGKKYGPPFSSGDIVGCGINFRTRTAFFTKNGLDLGTAFKDIDPKQKLFPAVGMKRTSEHVRVNFGRDRFAYDIGSHMQREKADVYTSLVRNTPLTQISPHHSEDELLRMLVSSYLAHDGYTETIKAFAEDARKLDTAFVSHPNGASGPNFGENSSDVSNRQRIRSAILAGEFDQAMEFTRANYPGVLESNEKIYFKLRCRKLIEMIAGTSSMTQASANGKSSRDEHMPDVFENDMEMDDNSHIGSEWERMDMSDENPKSMQRESLAEAVEYAQQLRIEFSADSRPEIRQALEESFSLVAYADPKNSVMAHLFDEDGRLAVAEELNSAILVSQGKCSVSSLERLLQQTSVLVSEASIDGGPSAFINISRDFLNGKVWDC